MGKVEFGKLDASCSDAMIPNKDYVSVLLSKDELTLLIDALEAINDYEDWRDHPERDWLVIYLSDFLYED